tara:strand:- start:835 stop:3750 length:2916 start_codon:yes stop_codon:yes gene_type:complete
MATKIPTYKTQTNFRSGFRAPQLKDATVPILKAVNNLTQDVLDNRAAKEGKEQGFQDVQSGTSTINEAEAKPNTIRGAAYKEGARSSFVAKTKNDYESQLTTLYNEHKLDIEKYNKEKDKLRENILKTTPSSLQQAITLDFDGESSKYTRQIETNIFNREEGEQLKIQTDRLSTLSDKIEDGIVNGAEDTEKMIAEYVDTLNSLYNVQQKFSVKDLSNYSNLLFHNILNAEIMAAYKVAEQNGEGEEFIKKLEEGGYKQFIKEFGTNYGDEIQKAFPQFESPSTISQIELDKIVKNLNSELKEDVKAKSADRTTWETDANAALNLYKSGIEPGYIFDRTEMEKLGFSESTILKYETSFRIAESVYPTIIEAKSTLPNDNATNLKTLQSDYFKLQNKKNLTADDREQLVILGAKIDGVNTILSNQRKYIADGDINLLMDQAGITYDTSTVEGLKDYHKIAEETFGLDSNIMKVAPQSQLDTDAEAVTSGNYGVLLQMSEKYGEYFETFIVDSGLDKQGYITVAQLINNGNPALAEQMFNALNDMEENTKSAKNQHGDFTGQDGALSLFEDKFLNGTGISGFDGFGEYITGNQDQADDIINGARALWTQIYLRTGDEAKASAGVITNFQKNFNMFEYNGMKVLLPIGVDADAVTEQLDIFANNPQKKGIMTNSLFDINDFKEDFEDNTFDNYDLVIDGGTIKIINKENAMGVVTVFKKLPSGSGEFSYTNTISVDTNKKTDANSEEVIIKDTVDIWNYNSNVGNKKFTTVVNNSVASGVSNFEKEKKAFDDQQAEILSQTGIDFNLYEKYKAFDTNNDGNITGEEYAKLLEFQSKEQDKLLTEPKKYSTYSKVETLMFEYAKLQNPPIDEAIGTISKDATTHAQLQAISMYIKDGEITDWIIDYLSDLESFEGLKDKANAKEVLSNWNNNKDRKTDTNPPTIMSPIMALYDYVQDIEQSNDKIDEIMKNFYPG